MKKYTFVEFIAASEGRDFNNIEESNLVWAKHWLKRFNLQDEIHQGDCTKESNPCLLCVFERYLHNYYEYTFNYEKFIKENGI